MIRPGSCLYFWRINLLIGVIRREFEPLASPSGNPESHRTLQRCSYKYDTPILPPMGCGSLRINQLLCHNEKWLLPERFLCLF